MAGRESQKRGVALGYQAKNLNHKNFEAALALPYSRRREERESIMYRLCTCTNVLNTKIKSAPFLSPQQLNSILESAQAIGTLPPDTQEGLRGVYAAGFNEEMQVLTAFSGAAVLATLLMCEGKPRRMA